MDTKLTLSLDKSVIKAAKNYAKTNKTSLSKLIEAYLAMLTSKKKSSSDITPLVASLSGVISMEDMRDSKEDYSDYLAKKYK